MCTIAGEDGRHLDFGQVREHELSGSEFVKRCQAFVGPDKLIVTPCLYVDAARVNSTWNHSLKPVSVTLAQHSRGVRLSTSGAGLLGYIPEVKRPKSISTSQFTNLKPHLTALLWVPFLDSIAFDSVNGFAVQPCGFDHAVVVHVTLGPIFLDLPEGAAVSASTSMNYSCLRCGTDPLRQSEPDNVGRKV